MEERNEHKELLWPEVTSFLARVKWATLSSKHSMDKQVPKFYPVPAYLKQQVTSDDWAGKAFKKLHKCRIIFLIFLRWAYGYIFYFCKVFFLSYLDF